MLLFSVFVTEYFAGELAYIYLDGDWFLGDYGDFSKSIDISMLYYMAVGTIDFAVWKYLDGIQDKSQREEVYLHLAIFSIFANLYGWYIYMVDADAKAYEGMLAGLLILKASLLDKALNDAGQYILGFARRIRSCLVYSDAFLYLTELVNEEKRARL